MDKRYNEPLRMGDSIAGYTILREIGYDSLGIVYEASNPILRDMVAIRQFAPAARAFGFEFGETDVKTTDNKELAKRILNRFEDQVRVQYDFDHPNLRKVKLFVRTDDTGYVFSEFIDGSPLAEFLRLFGGGFTDEAMLRRTMEPIADALCYIHERMTLHQSISPDHILMEKSGRPVLVGFGADRLNLLKDPDTSHAAPLWMLYAPVEQFAPSLEQPEGYYTDIFALAGSMYHMLAGDPPIRSMDRALADKDPYVPLAEVPRVKCSDAVCAAIDCGLALAPADRPQTMLHFMQMLGWR